MKRLERLEREVATRCREYENDCMNCPMNDACNVYAKARTDSEKIEALELMLTQNGSFSKLGETENSIIVGLLGILADSNATYNDILMISGFYGISTDPAVFGYHFITREGVEKRLGDSVDRLNNYNDFLEIFK